MLQCRVKTESELKLNVNSTKWKINSFSSIFVKSRPIETRRSERVSLQIVSLETPKFEQPFWNVEQTTMKINTKNPLTLKISYQYNQEGPAKPAEEFRNESMTENEEKNEIIEANYAWNIHLTSCRKMAFLNRDWSKLLP